jgi:hypothetical protein
VFSSLQVPIQVSVPESSICYSSSRWVARHAEGMPNPGLPDAPEQEAPTVIVMVSHMGLVVARSAVTVTFVSPLKARRLREQEHPPVSC